jgi:hypothetical protein
MMTVRDGMRMTGALPVMSVEAMVWALTDAPGVPAHCVGALMGLAHHADEDGRNAYPSEATLAAYARKSRRQVQNDVDALAAAGLIRRGDQAQAARLPAHRRPVVYDLVMEHSPAVDGVKSTSPHMGCSPLHQMKPTSPHDGVQSTSPHGEARGPDLRESDGVQSTSPHGETNGVKPASPKPPTTEDKKTTSKSKEPAKSPDALFDAPPAEPKRGRRLKPGTDPRFDAWYAAYPKHVDRGDAEAVWATVMAAGVDPVMLTEAATSYRTDQRVLSGYVKSPARWLRGKCWMDEPEPPRPQPANGTRPTNFTDEEYNRGWS